MEEGTKELCWLIGQLQQEREAVEVSEYPIVHWMLVQNLAHQVAKCAQNAMVGSAGCASQSIA